MILTIHYAEMEVDLHKDDAEDISEKLDKFLAYQFAEWSPECVFDWNTLQFLPDRLQINFILV